MKVSGILYVQGGNSYSDADGTKYGIAIHNTSNNATAAAEASYARTRPDGVSSHFYCDAVQVIQSLDTTARAGHAGSSQGNQNAVAVEITGTNDKSRAWWLANVAWGTLGRVLAEVCRTYGIAVRRASVAEMQANPKVRAFYSHDDMRRAWGGTDHDDPGPNFPWDRLFAAVTGNGDDMEQTDPLIAPWQNGTVGNALAVVMETRKAAVVDDASTGYGAPAPNSTAGRVRDIQAKVATLSTGGVDQAAINTAVKAALADPAVVGALVKAINDDAAARLAE